MIKVVVHPIGGRLKPLQLIDQGSIVIRQVGQRMAEACQEVLASENYQADIKIIYDRSY